MANQDESQIFHRRFREQSSDIEQKLDAIETDTNNEAVDELSRRLTALSNDVRDASQSLPAYDQRIYTNTLKTLHEKVQQKRAPKSRFSFKNKKQPSKVFPVREDSPAPDRDVATTSAPDREAVHQLPAEMQDFLTAIRKDSIVRFPSLPSIVLDSLQAKLLVLPTFAKASTGSRAYLTALQSCVIDLTLPTEPPHGQPLPSLHAKNISDSLLLCGNVSGPVHITSLKNSKLVVACQQLRVHNCSNCEIYLDCSTRPIIEESYAIGFASAPIILNSASRQENDNQWAQVDDFSWLKGPDEPSPHWKILDHNHRMTDTEWQAVTEITASLAAAEKITGSASQLSEVLRLADLK